MSLSYLFINIIALKPQSDFSVFIFFLFCLLFILPPYFITTFNIKQNRKASHFGRSYFPPNLKYNIDNLMQAYISLAALLIDDDRSEAGKKVIYMNKYFYKYFPESNINFGKALTHSFHNPAKLESVTAWLNIKLPKQKDRIQIMYFLAGVSKVDGFINHKELKTLYSIATILDISPKEFNSIIAMYSQREQKSTVNNNSSQSRKKSARKIACEILGVSEFADMIEIKKAYRDLVKVHHPDRFYNESKEQQNIAEERFLIIQKAYETLEIIG